MGKPGIEGKRTDRHICWSVLLNTKLQLRPLDGERVVESGKVFKDFTEESFG